ncbi:MFS transporter [Pigmentiphaga soli]|uniref:MFS transporter n=1 Tax=Pigmentiphaga soli TaxID=1007095 RepID=A0ABP8GB60_9BURK
MTTSESAAPPPSGLSVFLLALASFASASAFRIVDPLLPHLAREFAVSTGSASRAVTVFAIAYGIAQFLYGPLGDRIGKYRTITAATLLCSIGSIGAAFAPSLDMLIVCRILSGAAGAGIMPLALAWLGDRVPYERRQATLARFLLGSITGIAGGQLISGMFADTLGWRAGFVFLGLVYLAAGGALLLFRPARPDLPPSGPRPHVFAALGTLFRVRWARVVLATGFMEGAIVFGILAFVPNYLQQRFGVSATLAGMTGAMFALGGYVYVGSARRLVPRLGEAGMAAGAALSLCVVFLVFLGAPSWTLTLPAALLSGFGYYLLHSTLQTNATQMAPQVRGTAVSMFASFLFTGQSVGVWTVAQIDGALGMPWAFALAAVLMPAVALAFRHALLNRRRS